MNEYIGREAVITLIRPMPRARGGVAIARLDIDGGRWAWRTTYLRHTPGETIPF